MILIPALEIAAGKVVKAGSDKAVKDAPTALVKKLGKQGAVYFHLQDRDGASGEVMQRFVEEVVPFQVGGPGCDPAGVQGMLDAGADRVVVPADGLDKAALKSLAKGFGVRVLAEVELQEDAGGQLADLAKSGLRQVVLKPEAGKLADPEPLQAALEETELDVFVWSSVESQEDFAALRTLAAAGLRGVILDHAQCAKLLELAQTA